jgi:hypothetical protein
VQFTIGKATEDKLRRLQQLLKREVPNGDPAVLFDRALTVLLERVEGRKLGAKAEPNTKVNATAKAPAASTMAAKPVTDPKAPAANSRHIPAGVRRSVAERDAERCAFVAADGRRCREQAFLEFHHAATPYAHGGKATAGNIALHCRAHNAYEGRRLFGPHLPREVREARAAREASWTAVPERTGGAPM